MVSPPAEGGPKEAREKRKKIIIDDYALRNILTPKLKNMYDHYKIICGCECCIYENSMHYYLLLLRDNYPKKLQYKSQNDHNRR